MVRAQRTGDRDLSTGRRVGADLAFYAPANPKVSAPITGSERRAEV